MSSIALTKIYEFVENKKKFLILFFALILIIIYAMKMPRPSLQEYIEPRVDDVCSIITQNNITQQIILTTPYPLQCLDNKAEMNLFSIPILWETIEANPSWPVIYAPGTFLCAPEDLACQELGKTSLNRFITEFETLYFNNNSIYPIYVFQKITS
jgi:hypothetical protein